MPEIELKSGEIIKASQVNMNPDSRFIGIMHFPAFDGYIPQDTSAFEERFMQYNKDEIRKVLFGVAER